jgi:hypothetical protein
LLSSCFTDAWDRAGIARRYGTSWCEDDTLLVAGAEFGVARLDAGGRVRQRWLAHSRSVLDVLALDGTKCLITSVRDGVRSPSGDVAPEVYELHLESGSIERLTFDTLHDDLLVGSDARGAWIGSWEARASFFAAQPPNPMLRQFDVQSHSIRTVHERVPCPGFGDGFVDSVTVLNNGRELVFCSEGGEDGRLDLVSGEQLELPLWMIDAGDVAVRIDYEGSFDSSSFYGWHLTVRDDRTGIVKSVFSDRGHGRIYGLSLSPSKRYLSFVRENRSMADSKHLLSILDLETEVAMSVELPLATQE